MANARKLPSGAWRTQAKKSINGKVIRKSFTVHPDQTKGDSRKAKTQSELLAREWQMAVNESKVYGVTVRKAIDEFLENRSEVLSPSTLTNYKRLIPYFEPIMDICIDDLRTDNLQPLVNEWSMSVRAKTIRNRISFLLAALEYKECDRKFRIAYPQNDSKEIQSPDLEDVQVIIQNAPEDLKPILCLAAFGGLRRGEIAALKGKDILRDLQSIYVHADMVLKDKEYVYKPFTKNTLAGAVKLPKFVIDLIPEVDDPEAYVFNMNPNMISHRYDILKRKLRSEYNFHSFRHFAASFRGDLGIPRKYIEEVGRWKKGSKTIDRVYDNTLKSTRTKYIKIANEFIEENFRDIV